MTKLDENGQERGSLAESFPIKDLLMSTDGVFYATSEKDIELHGVTVFSSFNADAATDPLIPELLKRARSRTDESGKVTLVLIGSGITAAARAFFGYGADRIFIYDDPEFRSPEQSRYKAVFSHFLENYKPDAIMAAGNETGKALLSCLAGAAVKFSEKPLKLSAPTPPDPARRGELVICKL